MSINDPMKKTMISSVTQSKLQQIMDYCERSFMEQIGGGFNSQLEEVLNNIKQLSQEAKTYQDKQLYSELYFSLKNARAEISTEFKQHLKKYFKEKLEKKIKEDNTEEEVFDYRNLRIVSEKDEYRFIEEKKLEKNLEGKLNDELSPLNIRFESLLGEEKNPFAPEILIKALFETIQKRVSNEDAQRIIVNDIGKEWAEQLKATYQVLNNYLVSNNIVPDMGEYQRNNAGKDDKKSKRDRDIESDNNEGINNKNIHNNNSDMYNMNAPSMPNFALPDLPFGDSRGGASSNSNNSTSNFNSSQFENNGFSNLLNQEVPMPGFENLLNDNNGNNISENRKLAKPTAEDFERNDESEYRIRESDTPTEKIAKWSKSKNIIVEKFNNMLGRVRDVTPIKEAVIGTERPTIKTMPPGYTSIPAYQIRPSSYHKLISETLVAKRLAESKGEIFIELPSGVTAEQLSAHESLIVSKENSIMLNDTAVLKAFSGYQDIFKKMNMADAIKPDLDGNIPTVQQRNVLSEIVSANVQNHKMDPNETMIVDLLSLVFEKIFSHPQLPIHIKFLVSKLQIPILKTSLLDKTFFIYRDNPVRLFLDCLATHETLYNLEYHAKFEVIVDDLLTSDEINQEQFSLALEKIQTMLREYSAKENRFIEQVATPLSLEEKAIDNFDDVMEYVREKITKRTSYQPVISFVENVWAKAFADKWTSHNPRKENTRFMESLEIPAKLSLNQSLLIFEMIIWASEIKAKTFENREKLKVYRPKIYDGLNKLAIDLKISDDEVEKLKLILNEQHEKFISDVEKTKEEEAVMRSIEDKAVKQFLDKSEPIRKIKAAKKDIVKAKSDFDNIFSAGCWFEFIHDKSKLRLVWVSPQKTMFLFNNPDKKKVYKFDKSTVWAYYRSNHIKLINDEVFMTESLVDDAVSKKESENKDKAHLVAL